jgi:hypothetical protein
MDHIIKTFYDQNKFKSILWQLQNYGFARVLCGRERGICMHPMFVREQRDLSENMKRIVHLKNTVTKSEKTMISGASVASSRKYHLQILNFGEITDGLFMLAPKSQGTDQEGSLV